MIDMETMFYIQMALGIFQNAKDLIVGFGAGVLFCALGEIRRHRKGK